MTPGGIWCCTRASRPACASAASFCAKRPVGRTTRVRQNRPCRRGRLCGGARPRAEPVEQTRGAQVRLHRQSAECVPIREKSLNLAIRRRFCLSGQVRPQGDMTSTRPERWAAKGAVPNAEYPLACRRGVRAGAFRERLPDGWRAKPDNGRCTGHVRPG